MEMIHEIGYVLLVDHKLQVRKPRTKKTLTIIQISSSDERSACDVAI